MSSAALALIAALWPQRMECSPEDRKTLRAAIKLERNRKRRA